MEKTTTPLRRLADDIRANRMVLFCIFLYLAAAQYMTRSVCPVAILFGFPCPACGLTRAGLLLLRGHFSEAFFMHPCIYLILPYFLYLCFLRYFRKNPDKKPRLLLPVTAAVGGVFLLVYILRLITGTLPPLETRGVFSLLRQLV